MISSELPEVLRLADRIAVMAEGRLTAVSRTPSHPKNVMDYATRFSAEGTIVDSATPPLSGPPRPRRRDLSASPRGARFAGARSLQQLLAAASLIVIVVFFSFASPRFFTANNFISILTAAT